MSTFLQNFLSESLVEDVPWECSKALIILKQGYQVRQENIFGSDYAFLEPDISLDCTAEGFFLPRECPGAVQFFRPAGFYFFLATFHHRRETLLAETELKLSCSGINRYKY